MLDIYAQEYELKNAQGALRCVLEDSIMQKGRYVTAGSKMLEGFVSPIDATAVTRLAEAGVSILGKTKMAEFGIGAVSGDESCVQSGAVTAVAEGIADFALCNDFSGDVRRQAVLAGLCYIHPTYGTVSRYGLIPAICSMDQIGVVCKTVSEGFEALSIIAGSDSGDGAMYPEKTYSYCGGKTVIKAAVASNALDRVTDEEKNKFINALQPFETVNLELLHFEVYSKVMYILGCAEISNNISRYDGIKLGYRAADYNGLEELYAKSRTEAFGESAKLCAIMGAMVLSQDNYARLYDKAMRIRRLIKESLDFDKYDVIAVPAVTSDEPYTRNAFYALPQLAGLPSITVPVGGAYIQLIAGPRNENALYSAAEVLGL